MFIVPLLPQKGRSWRMRLEEMLNYKCLINKKCPASLSFGEGTRMRPVL